MQARALVLLSFFSVQSQCQCKSQKDNRFSSYSLVTVFVSFLASSMIIFASGQVLVGGLSEEDKLSSVEIFPSPPTSRACSVPDLPRGRQGSGREGHRGHSLSHLSGGKQVVCGGNKLPSRVAKFCFAWTTSNTSWTHLHTMRSSSILCLSQNNSTVLHFYNSKVDSQSWVKIIVR